MVSRGTLGSAGGPGLSCQHRCLPGLLPGPKQAPASPQALCPYAQAPQRLLILLSGAQAVPPPPARAEPGAQVAVSPRGRPLTPPGEGWKWTSTLRLGVSRVLTIPTMQRPRLEVLPGPTRRRPRFLVSVTLTSTGPCPRFWRQGLGPSGRRRESQVAKPVEKQRLHSCQRSCLGPGWAARTVAATTWLSGRSARPLSVGLGRGAASSPLIAGLWAVEQCPAWGAGKVGEAAVRAGAGGTGDLQNHLPRPQGPPFPGECSGPVLATGNEGGADPCGRGPMGEGLPPTLWGPASTGQARGSET